MLRIANQTFSTGDEAKQFVRHLLAKYEIGTEITEDADLKFLLELLKRHPEYAEKFSEGSKKIRVVRNPAQKATELEVETSAGRRIRTPWVICVLD